MTSILTMSFYLTLSSDGSKDTFPNNHGGDFSVQLQHTLDLRSEPWEVALVDMMYTGQAFPNLPIEDSVVTLKVSGKPAYENDYFITYDQAENLWIYYKLEAMTGGSAGPRTIVKSTTVNLPKQHYSWPVFVDTDAFD